MMIFDGIKLIKPSNNVIDELPSGKRLHRYGNSPFFMGKSTISMAMASIVM